MNRGLSQTERRQRVEIQHKTIVMENRVEHLLAQAEAIAGMIRNIDSKEDQNVFFDSFLNELKSIHDDVSSGRCSGNTEPSQALLYSFIHNLSQILQQFNDRWNSLPQYYFNDILRIEPKINKPDKTWIAFGKSTSEDVVLLPGTRFLWNEANAENKIYYHLTQKVIVTNARIDKAYSLHFVKNVEIYPACLLNAPVTLRKTDLLDKHLRRPSLFDEIGVPQNTYPLGIQISSPTLLLREGHRNVTVSFCMDNMLSFEETIRRLSEKTEKDYDGLSVDETDRILVRKLLKDIFFLEISTTDGWKKILLIDTDILSEDNKENQSLVVSFSLSDDFAATTACNTSLHGIDTEYPTLRVLLNRDSWLYPYCWLKDMSVNKVEIKVNVDEINNILIYNDLGKIDNSAPFSLFGANTSKGASFTIGCYEMAIKPLKSVTFRMKWQGLPDHPRGLCQHYEAYNQGIGNDSFKLQYQYLSNGKWKDNVSKNLIYLFSSKVKRADGTPIADRQLSEESELRCSELTERPPLNIAENNYDYNILSESGFIKFKLTDPDIGFGQKAYNNLFSEHMIKKLSKKKKSSVLNAPISPLVEKISLSYTSSETIYLNKNEDNHRLILSHIYPLGQAVIYPKTRKTLVPFLYSLDTDANILLALSGVKGEEVVRLYFDFYAEKGMTNSLEIPSVRWYWGDGHHWEILPDDSVYKNTTRNFFNSGEINIYLPRIPNDSFGDKDGRVWLRAGITKHQNNIADIRQIRINVAKVYCDQAFVYHKRDEGYTLNASEANIPGITLIEQIAPFVGECNIEDDTAKIMRVSEYVSHRGRAVAAKDFERIVLEAFSDVSRVKCFCHYNAKTAKKQAGIVTIAVIPPVSEKETVPWMSSERLLEIRIYLKERISQSIDKVVVINPVYEQVLVYCEVSVDKVNYPEFTSANTRTYVRNSINKVLAPWQYVGGTPLFGYTLCIEQLHIQIEQIKQVDRVSRLSVVHIYKDIDGKSHINEYTQLKDTVCPRYPHAILIPAGSHVVSISDGQQGGTVDHEFGINKMEINENFIICQQKIERP